MNINYWNHIESMAVVDGTQQIFPKNILSLFDFLNLRPEKWCVLYILTWKCASRHNGVQFFITHLASWLRTRRFSERLLFDPPEPQIIGKTQCFATFLPFRASASSFFLLFLFYSSFF